MPGHIPSLDDASLLRLRALVLAMRSSQATGNAPLPMADLVSLADDATSQAAVTIDFGAEKQLGMPLVILRASAAETSRSATTGTVEATMLQALSVREREVATLVAEGLANKQIAARLGITLATVKDHVHSILSKTGASNRAGIAATVTAGLRSLK